MWLMAAIAFPIAYLLDKLLGQELGTVYSNQELQKLVDIHAEMEGMDTFAVYMAANNVTADM